jgi:hypothetical protein
MNTRTINAPAKIASGAVIHQETARLRYMRYQSSK